MKPFSMKLNKIFLAPLFCLITTVGFGQKIEIEKINASKPEEIEAEGIIYALPKTVLVLEIEVVKTDSIPVTNPSCDLGCQLRTSLKPITKRSTTFQVKNYSLTTKAVPDTEQIYVVNPESKWNKNKSVSFTLSNLGLIQGTEISIENKTFEIISSGLSTIISTASLFVAGGPAPPPPPSESVKPEAKLLKLINSKEMLLSSAYGAALETIQFQLVELNKLIDTELAALVGKRVSKTTVLRFEIELAKEEPASLNSGSSLKIDKLKIDKEKGVYIDPTLKAVNPHILYPAEFLSTSEVGKNITVTVHSMQDSFGKIVSQMKLSSSVRKGLAYRIPVEYSFSVSYDGTPKLAASLQIAQAGKVVHLPYKMDNATIAYYENLGSIKTVSVSSSAIVSDSFATGQGIISDTKKLIDGQSEADKLTKEVTELELLVRKKAAEDALAPINDN